MRLPLLLPVALGLLLAACRSETPSAPEQPPAPRFDLVGTWEVLDDPDMPVSRQGRRYTFTPDSTVRIFRPRSLGPVSTLQAAYDFVGDTLVIRSEFDAELLLPELVGDTLTLSPVDGGRPMVLIRAADPVPQASPPTAPPLGPDSVYSPPGDLPPEEMRQLGGESRPRP